MRFTRFLFVIALAAPALLPNAAQAQFGLGVVLGEPTGVTARFMSGGNNFQLHAAWSFAKGDAFRLSGDYLRSGNLNSENFPPFYYGIGARIKFASESQVTIRFPLGLNHFFRNDPFEIFGEVVPGLRVIPNTDFDLGLAVGFRYYFGQGGAGA